MPFKHQVTDRNGKIHQRVSQERLYHFAAVIHFKEHTSSDGRSWAARSKATWSRTETGARTSADQYRFAYGHDGVEILPCTPVAIGRHAK